MQGSAQASGECSPDAFSRSRAHSAILDWLESELRSGALKVGDKLPSERALAEKFAIARASVREAIRILDAMGIIHTATGSGPSAGAIIVSEPAAAFTLAVRMHAATRMFPVPDLVRTRILLETEAARCAARLAVKAAAGGQGAKAGQGAGSERDNKAASACAACTVCRSAFRSSFDAAPGVSGVSVAGFAGGYSAGSDSVAVSDSGPDASSVAPSPCAAHSPGYDSSAYLVHRAEVLTKAESILDQLDDPDLPALEFHALDQAFHRSLAELGNNAVLDTLLASLTNATINYVQNVMEKRPDRDQVRLVLNVQHRGILEATAAVDGELAAARISEHILWFHALVRETLGE